MFDKFEDEFNMDKQRDIAKNRPVRFVDGTRAFIRQTDPYGYWSFKWAKGKTPEELSDVSFTNFDAARMALISWASKNDKELESINKGYGVVTKADGETLFKR